MMHLHLFSLCSYDSFLAWKDSLRKNYVCSFPPIFSRFSEIQNLPLNTLIIMAEKLPDIQVTAKSFTLVFLPFHEGHHEFIQPDYNIAVNKNVVSLSKNL